MTVAVGDNKLMPVPDCSCVVINARTGYVRDNKSWIIGRVVRDFENWMDNGDPNGPVRSCVRRIRDQKRASLKANAKLRIAGFCVSVYRATGATPGSPGYDTAYYLGFLTAFVQIAISAIPFGLYGNWSILLVAVCGTLLASISCSIPQWTREKWACRTNCTKTFILTKGNGSQHAIVIKSEGKGLDLEDLAGGHGFGDDKVTRTMSICLAIMWLALLVTAAGIKDNTWYLLGIGSIGMLHNILVAGWRRTPSAFGLELEYEDVIGNPSVMGCLYEVEERYPYVGRSLRGTLFPGTLRPDEIIRWQKLDANVEQRYERTKNLQV
jgi:hypothetical protein